MKMKLGISWTLSKNKKKSNLSIYTLYICTVRIRNMHKSAKAAAAKSIKLNKDKYRGRQAQSIKKGKREIKEGDRET